MRLLLVIIMLLMIGNSLSQELDDNDPGFREKILWEGRRLYSEGRYQGAFAQFYYGVKNWNDQEQFEDKLRACSSLFTILYITDTVSEREILLKECPSKLTDIWFEKENRDYEPLLKKFPCYPIKALTKKIEGWAIVEFNIETDGRTSDAKVIDSSNRVFNECAIQAASEFIYLPAIKEGNKIKSNNVKSRLVWDFKE